MGQATAQDLVSPTFTYSHKKTSYITLKDGSEITGTIKDLDRKKGLIEEIKIVNEAGKKLKLIPEYVASMYSQKVP
jgi:transcriptional antiterminator Rof (Rho-off)